jgi:DNA (cytosine-5)-methyltransferase 1
VLVASKLGPIGLIGKTHRKSRWRTVRKTIGRLDRLNAGGRNGRDRLHRARALNGTNLERIKHTPPGGSWMDWPDRLRLECHKKPSGETYRSIYGRMKWDEPAPTLTTHCTGIGNGRYGHPNQDRAISLREAALLQSFPRRYKFVGPREKVINKTVSRQIGNAVPVRLGQIIARSIKSHLEEVMVREKKGSSHATATKYVDVSRQNKGHRP